MDSVIVMGTQMPKIKMEFKIINLWSVCEFDEQNSSADI